jgi:RNA polymerase sigma-70 factor (ECF subfamily)
MQQVFVERAFGKSCPLCCWDLDQDGAADGRTLCRYCREASNGGRANGSRTQQPVTILAERPDPRDEERDLVLRAQAFDETALSVLFASYYPRMYTYGLAQLRNVDAAEDFASDVILRVLDGIRRYRLGEQPFSAWVFRIARNRLIDLQRRRTRCRQVPLDENVLSINGHGQVPMKQVLDIDEIRLGLADLTEAQAQVIVLRFQQDLDVGTVARILGRSERAVKSLQFRALAALRRALSEGRQPVGAQVAVPTG